MSDPKPEPVRCVRCGLPYDGDHPRTGGTAEVHMSMATCITLLRRDGDEFRRLLAVAREAMQDLTESCSGGQRRLNALAIIDEIDRAKKPEERT